MCDYQELHMTFQLQLMSTLIIFILNCPYNMTLTKFDCYFQSNISFSWINYLSEDLAC